MNLNKLHQIILSPSLFKKSDFKNEDIILDSRDENPFDSEWMDMYNTINQEYKNYQLNKHHEEIEAIRKDAFMASEQFFGTNEISSYISDDFDLIAKGIVLNSHDKRITWLLNYYIKQGVPHTSINKHSKFISDY